VRLTRDFYARDTLVVAAELIGKHVVRLDAGGVRRVGRIVETEAYKGPTDRAAHSFRGHTPRTAVMFGPPGHVYVFMIYGFWFCLNFVTEPEGQPCAVLIRALEPVAGITSRTSGPGLLCRALDIDRALNGADLCGEVLWVEEPAPAEASPVRVARSPRIGVDYAGSWAKKPWRFFDRDSPWVSTARQSRARSPGTRRSRPSR
jgi:DNA-3-methyladenine glycosylase